MISSLGQLLVEPCGDGIARKALRDGFRPGCEAGPIKHVDHIRGISSTVTVAQTRPLTNAIPKVATDDAQHFFCLFIQAQLPALAKDKGHMPR